MNNIPVDDLLFLRSWLKAHGYSELRINKLIDPKTNKLLISKLISGHAEIRPVERIIDCDAEPSMPFNLHLAPTEEQIRSIVCGKWKWSPGRVGLHCCTGQFDGVEGYTASAKLTGVPVLPAKVLDFYLSEEYQHLIPEEWKGKRVHFGTRFVGADGSRAFRYIYFDKVEWLSGLSWLQFGFDEKMPFAIDSGVVPFDVSMSFMAPLVMGDKEESLSVN